MPSTINEILNLNILTYSVSFGIVGSIYLFVPRVLNTHYMNRILFVTAYSYCIQLGIKQNQVNVQENALDIGTGSYIMLKHC